MKKAQTVSIIIPAYNEERYIAACLDAIARQTVAPDEIIVVDNNSTDKTVKMAKSYPFVKLLHEKKQGIVYARNRGFNAAKSEIIGRIDADTILPKDWVKRVKHFYSDTTNMDIALTGGGYFYNIRTPRFNGWILSQLAYRMNRFVTGFYILWGSNMAIPKKLWQETMSHVCLRNDIHEDFDLAIHVHAKGYAIEYDESLRVGVYLKRVWENRQEQAAHMARWPRTLRAHGYKDWWLGSVGNGFLRFIIQPYVFVSEGLGRLMGRRLKYSRRIG